jgi:hypothetical protein
MSDREDVLRKVRGLLSKADGGTTEAESDALRQKADELMLRYAIEQAELDKSRPEQRETPVARKFDLCNADSTIKDELLQLFGVVTHHTRCRSVIHGASYTSPGLTITGTVVGFPADTEYAEMLYTSLWLQMTMGLEPKPDPKLSFEDNVITMMGAGVSRKRIAELMGLEPKKVTGKMSRIWKAHAEEHGLYAKRPLPVTFGRNFAAGYIARVDLRLIEIRKRSDQNVAPVGGSAIVLRDRARDVLDAYQGLFPKLGAYKSKQRSKFDNNARAKGDEAGKSADLGLKKIKGSKALPEG